MPFKPLRPQSLFDDPCADAYTLAALGLSRLAAMETPCVLDIPYGDDPDQRLDVFPLHLSQRAASGIRKHPRRWMDTWLQGMDGPERTTPDRGTLRVCIRCLSPCARASAPRSNRGLPQCVGVDL